MLVSAFVHMRVDRISVAAGAFAYRWFLSIFPLIVALLGVASVLSLPRSVIVTLLHGVTKALPAGAATVFTEAIDHTTSRGSADLAATVVASIVALWSAVSGMVILEEVLGMAYGLRKDRSFLAKRGVALILLGFGVVCGGVASALIVFGAPLGNEVRGWLPATGVAFPVAWTVTRWLIALVLVNLLFSFLYYLAPNHATRVWRWTSPGAIVATVVWAVISLGFSLYTTSFNSYDRTYGAFAGVAILVFWLYLTGLAVFVGGEINAALDRVGSDVSSA